jgi:ribonuclease P protein component
MNKINSYSGKEKLKSRKALETLFASGKSFSSFPIKVFYTAQSNEAVLPAGFSVNAGVGVSSRNFKKAVHRNRIKRLLREVYRTQKQPLHETILQKQLVVSVFFLYIGKEMPEHLQLQEAMGKVLEKFRERI